MDLSPGRTCVSLALGIFMVSACAAGPIDEGDVQTLVPDQQQADGDPDARSGNAYTTLDDASSTDATKEVAADTGPKMDAASDAPAKDAAADALPPEAGGDAASDAGATDASVDAPIDAHPPDAAMEAGPLNACGVCDRIWVCNGFAAQWSSVGGRCVNQANNTGLRCNGILDGTSANNVGTWSGDNQHLTLVFNSFGGTHTIACVP